VRRHKLGVPADAFKPASTVCRASAGACDPAESCPGTGPSCPSDAKSTGVCRAAAGVCDVPESCDGVSNNCPADQKSTAVCRPATGTCDIAESCDGVSNNCPADAHQPDGTTCSDGNSCTTGDNCPERHLRRDAERRRLRRRLPLLQE